MSSPGPRFEGFVPARRKPRSCASMIQPLSVSSQKRGYYIKASLFLKEMDTVPKSSLYLSSQNLSSMSQMLPASCLRAKFQPVGSVKLCLSLFFPSLVNHPVQKGSDSSLSRLLIPCSLLISRQVSDAHEKVCVCFSFLNCLQVGDLAGIIQHAIPGIWNIS